MTKDLIIQSQTGDSEATLKLIEKFDPLLKKYAYVLFYEDAYNDLLLDFLKFLNKLRLDTLRNTNEGTLVSYIHTSIRSNYIKRLIALKKLHNFVPYSALSDSELYYAETAIAASDTHFDFEFTEVEHILTELELLIVKMIYLMGYSVEEIASIHSTSRQAVNQAKNRALKKLRIFYADIR